MLTDRARRVALAALAVALLAASGESAWAQTSEPKRAPNEAEEILKESKKNDPETAKEFAECLKEWGPQTQMTKEEWATSCRSTLRYFPENP